MAPVGRARRPLGPLWTAPAPLVRVPGRQGAWRVEGGTQVSFTVHSNRVFAEPGWRTVLAHSDGVLTVHTGSQGRLTVPLGDRGPFIGSLRYSKQRKASTLSCRPNPALSDGPNGTAAAAAVATAVVASAATAAAMPPPISCAVPAAVPLPSSLRGRHRSLAAAIPASPLRPRLPLSSPPAFARSDVDAFCVLCGYSCNRRMSMCTAAAGTPFFQLKS